MSKKSPDVLKTKFIKKNTFTKKKFKIKKVQNQNWKEKNSPKKHFFLKENFPKKILP